MITRLALLIALALLLAGCQTPAPDTAAKTFTYRCDDGRSVQAGYPDTDTAMLTLDGTSHRLHRAISADGARYVGDDWQWWKKGMQQAWLAPLKPGETFTSARGVDCHAP